MNAGNNRFDIMNASHGSVFTVNGSNVGIGTVTPSHKLIVFNNATGTGLNLIGSASGTRNDTGIGFSAVNATSINYARIGIAVLDGTAGTEKGSLVFSTTNNNVLFERMTINNNGYVGIGTSTPKEELSVNGNIRSKQVKVEVNNWPDYVFKSSYQLPSLSEIKAYIEKNLHLPDMPSEKEVAENGINLGEIVKLQTKKIEELTLYAIEQKERLTEQQQKSLKQDERIAQLEKALSRLTQQQ